MTSVNWDSFERLPGAADTNFEKLCRAIIRLHYDQFGSFAALAQQPGIEFHLRLHAPCALGESGRWYGWQCRWYGLPSGRAIGKTRRDKIEAAIKLTERELPGLTDWVLWTRWPLTAGDQTWFNGLATRMRLHLWSAVDAETYLSGPAEFMRGTYFGELVLDPAALSRLRDEAIAPIRIRWQPEVHQTLDAEDSLRRMLGGIDSWDDLRLQAEQLDLDAAGVEAALPELSGPLAEATIRISEAARATARMLNDIHAALERGDLDLFRQQLTNRPAKPHAELMTLPRRLRASRKRAGLAATNALAGTNRARELLDEVESYLGAKLIAVVAGAGYGKTELAAQLTAEVGTRPAGLLLHGRDLHAGHSLDDLARRVVIQGNPVASMEALIAAVNTAGERAQRRLPIVIDGLNEAEDPRDWQGPLAALDEVLSRYPYVLVVVTLRGEFDSEALPIDVARLELKGFQHNVIEAVRRYFAHYLIDPADAELPLELFQHPLTLRLFCEVTNPKREQIVGIEQMPGSLTALFDRYLQQAAERIAELAPRNRRYFEQDVRAALDEIGTALWKERGRSLKFAKVRRRLGDEGRPWNESLVRALEQEGILLRVPGRVSPVNHIAVVYDALAGHIVANALLSRYGRSGLGKLLKKKKTLKALTGTRPKQFPLAADTLRALAGLMPRRLHRMQLWPLLDKPLRIRALRDSADLEGGYIDAATVEELKPLVTYPIDTLRDMFDRLRQTRGALWHPLNAEFLDDVLRMMGVADRDLRWTEWVRRNSTELLADLRRLERQWRSSLERSPADLLRARWVMWTLTTTSRLMRDQATRTLYWFGRGDPAALYDLCFSALAINDPYIPERMLAASYGVTMARQYDINDHDFVDQVLPRWAEQLYATMFAPDAEHATTHLLSRNYARRMIEIAARLNPNLLAPEQLERTRPPYQDGGIRKWGKSKDKDDGNYRDGNHPLGFHDDDPMDRLGPAISKYHPQHPEYKTAKAQLWWRIYDLGYSLKRFGSIDSQLANQRHIRVAGIDDVAIAGYGRKYSWIATCELAGYRDDLGLLRRDWDSGCENWTHVDLDPSFPEELRKHQLVSDDLLGDRQGTLDEWIVRGPDRSFEELCEIGEIEGKPGPWVLLDGHVTQQDEPSGRYMFCFLVGMLVDDADAKQIEEAIRSADRIDVDMLSVPETHYTYAGEIPWCETYPENEASTVPITTGFVLPSQPERQLGDTFSGALPSDSAVVEAKKEPLADDVDPAELLHNEPTQILGEGTDRVEDELGTRVLNMGLPLRISHDMTSAVTRHGWESYHSELNPGTGASVPTRQFADQLGLTSRPQTFDLYDSEGQLASVSIEHGEPFSNRQDFTYLRKDLLDRYLESSGQRLVWIIAGERAYHSSRDFGGQAPQGGQSYARYVKVRLYD